MIAAKSVGKWQWRFFEVQCNYAIALMPNCQTQNFYQRRETASHLKQNFNLICQLISQQERSPLTHPSKLLSKFLGLSGKLNTSYMRSKREIDSHTNYLGFGKLMQMSRLTAGMHEQHTAML